VQQASKSAATLARFLSKSLANRRDLI